MITIDASGQPCPIPVIKTKKAISELPAEGGIIKILVDNVVATENLEKLVTGLGHTLNVSQNEKGYEVEIVVGQGVKDEKVYKEKNKTGLTVAIGCNSMGKGSDELGKILMKGFIYSLIETEVQPEYLLFYNSGAMLTVDDSNTVEDLKTLEQKGTKIFTCGTCLDYYKLKDKLSVGEIANMYNIATIMSNSEKLINL